MSFRENNSKSSVVTTLAALLVGLRFLREKGQAVSENFKGVKRYQKGVGGWWMESSLSPLGSVDADRMLKCCNPTGRT